MRVVVLYNEPGEGCSVEDRDVLVQCDAVVSALERLGHSAFRVGCDLDLGALQRELLAIQPDVVFNLVESLGGTDRLMVVPAMLLDALRMPYTGAQSDAIRRTSNKLDAKRHLLAAGLPTAPWLARGQSYASGDSTGASNPSHFTADQPWILKPIFEHASFGLDDDALVLVQDASELEFQLCARERFVGKPLFAEKFIDGRELNLSLLGGQVLPPAEIDFSTFPISKPRIVGQRAKWNEESFEYQQTPRSFEFSESDGGLLRQLKELAERCWQLFGLRGYARVDFRVDEDNVPWILEVNANPCLSPDAGFVAALDQAAISFDEAVRKIIADALACEWPGLIAMRDRAIGS